MTLTTKRNGSPQHLFVYGTLLPEHAPPEVQSAVAKLRPVGEATLRGAQRYRLRHYPGAVKRASGPVVHGRLFRLPRHSRRLLQALDNYEGFDPGSMGKSLFVRRAHRVRLQDGPVLPAWVYFLSRKPQGAHAVVSGRYSPSAAPNR